MKRHYADARADDLWWILAPTTRVVGVMTGATFVAAAGRRIRLARTSVPDREIVRRDQLHDRRVRHAGVRAASPRRIRPLGVCACWGQPAGELWRGGARQRDAHHDRHVARRSSGCAVDLQRRPTSIASKGSWCISRAWWCCTSSRDGSIGRDGLAGRRRHDRCDTTNARASVSAHGSATWLVLRGHARASARKRRGAIRHAFVEHALVVLVAAPAPDRARVGGAPGGPGVPSCLPIGCASSRLLTDGHGAGVLVSTLAQDLRGIEPRRALCRARGRPRWRPRRGRAGHRPSCGDPWRSRRTAASSGSGSRPARRHAEPDAAGRPAAVPAGRPCAARADGSPPSARRMPMSRVCCWTK